MSTAIKYDVIVIGVGSMGASACYHLAKRGVRVLGLEQFHIAHDLGSHGGQSRIIRMAYGENTQYVPLLQRAYDNWKTLERETQTQLYFETGLLYFGEQSSEFLNTLHRSSEEYDVPISYLTTEVCSKQFPQFQAPDHFQRILEPQAGLLLPEKCVRLLAAQAAKYGAELHEHERVQHWTHGNGNITVTTDRSTYEAQKLVITAGPWASQLIPGYERRLRVTRQALAWVRPRDWEAFELGNFPTWLYEEGDHVYYGFPILRNHEEGPRGLKVAIHHPLGEETHPDAVDRESRATDEQAVIRFLERVMPAAYEGTVEMKTCLYTNSPDDEFIVDFLPDHVDRVVIACGFSGHGFKFASAIGDVLADLASEGETAVDRDFLKADRFLG